MTNISAENQMEMAAEIYDKKERVLECLRASRVDSSPNAIPSGVFEMTCKSLVQTYRWHR